MHFDAYFTTSNKHFASINTTLACRQQMVKNIFFSPVYPDGFGRKDR
jgi:hypothetical protein